MDTAYALQLEAAKVGVRKRVLTIRVASEAGFRVPRRFDAHLFAKGRFGVPANVTAGLGGPRPVTTQALAAGSHDDELQAMVDGAAFRRTHNVTVVVRASVTLLVAPFHNERRT